MALYRVFVGGKDYGVHEASSASEAVEELSDSYRDKAIEAGDRLSSERFSISLKLVLDGQAYRVDPDGQPSYIREDAERRKRRNNT